MRWEEGLNRRAGLQNEEALNRRAARNKREEQKALNRRKARKQERRAESPQSAGGSETGEKSRKPSVGGRLGKLGERARREEVGGVPEIGICACSEPPGDWRASPSEPPGD